MQYVIDRFEGNVAICENDDLHRIEIEKTLLPNGAKEGSTIIIGEDSTIILFDDVERKQRIADKMKSVWK